VDHGWDAVRDLLTNTHRELAEQIKEFRMQMTAPRTENAWLAEGLLSHAQSRNPDRAR
jgi:hypothetical protein